MRRAKARGLPVTAEAAPHHFALNELEVEGYRTFAKVSPPLRAEDDRRAVVAGLADGTIDVIASDHCPQDQDSKRLPFAQAEFGVVGLETLLPISLQLVHDGVMSLLAVLAKLTCAPADLLGLEAGRLRKGAPADLILFDPEAPWKIREDDLRSLSKNTPFDGRLVQGKVLWTLVDGRTIYDDGRWRRPTKGGSRAGPRGRGSPQRERSRCRCVPTRGSGGQIDDLRRHRAGGPLFRPFAGRASICRCVERRPAVVARSRCRHVVGKAVERALERRSVAAKHRRR